MKSRFVLSLVALVIAIEYVQAQFTGPPAFTARWYTKEHFRDWPNNDFGYIDLVATTTLPMVPFAEYNGYSPDTIHLVPNEILSQTDEMGMHVYAKCLPPSTGMYKFSIAANDGMRFLSNGRILSNPALYSMHGFTEDIFEMDLVAGEEYFWEIHYFEFSGGQGLEFKVEIDGAWEFVNSDWCTPATLPESIHFGGKAYRALDWTPPSSNEDSCQGNEVDSGTFLYHDIPVESNDIYALLSRFKFGAKCIIVRKAADSNVFIALKTKPADLTPANRYCGMAGKYVHRTYGSLRLAGDTNCEFRFLIETDLDPSLPDLSYKYTAHSGVHSLFFKEALFATLHNIGPWAESHPIQNDVAYKLPPGYILAPNDGLTKAALLGSAYTFGLDCVLLADGGAVSTTTGLDCGGNFGIDNTSIAGYFAVTGSDISDVLIKNPSGLKADAFRSWDETSGNLVPVLGTNLVLNDGWLYGAVAGTAPNLDATDVCQDRGLALPTGYSLVPPGDSGLLSVAKSAKFGSGCLVMSDGSGFAPVTGAACSTELVQSTSDGVLYTAVGTCPSTVMMRTLATSDMPTRSATPRPKRMPVDRDSSSTASPEYLDSEPPIPADTATITVASLSTLCGICVVGAGFLLLYERRMDKRAKIDF